METLEQHSVLEVAPDEIAALRTALDAVEPFDEVMRLVDAARRAWVGAGLLTVNLRTSGNPGRDIELRRIWSSDESAYPVGGRKSKPKSAWTTRLFDGNEIVVTEGDEAMAKTFDDQQKMASLGLHAGVNVPIVRDGRCAAAFNCMGPLPRWKPSQVAALRLLASLAEPWILREVEGKAAVQHGLAS